jgi:hypothetical protein
MIPFMIASARRARVLACVLALLAAASLANGQEFRGTILGRVTDPDGAALPGATVTVTNEGTGVGWQSVTESDGVYAARFLVPGTYRVQAEMQGFSKFVQSGIRLAIGQNATVNIQLKLGSLSETVEVTGQASLLDTTSGGLGQVIDREVVEDMPLNGRMVFMLNRLAGGVNWQVPTFGATGTSGLRPFDNQGGSAWSLNGGRLATNEFLLDGAPDSTRGRYNFSPPVDAVEEFKIQTNTYDAQYGRTGGGIVNIALKTGANDLHGRAWNFMKNERLNANNALNNTLGQERPPYVAHQYGALVTGPLRKGKTFFMASFEGLRERVPFPTTTSVPTERERRGDFSQSGLTIYDPLTTRTVDGRLVRDPFPGNVIPADRINPISLQVLQQVYPSPNVPGQRLNNFANSVNKARYDYDAELVRLDHYFAGSSRSFLTVYRNHRDEFRSNNGLQGTFANQGQWPQTRKNYGGILDWVGTRGPRTLLNARVAFTRFTESSYQTDVKEFDRGPLGFRNLPGQFLPRINLEEYTDIGVGGEGLGVVDNTASAQASYNHTFSRHTLKLGGDYRNIRSNPSSSGNSNGFFNFTRSFTRRDPNSADNTSGSSVASFLLGYPANANVGAGNARALQWHYLALFAHDDVRVTPKLTLNLGLRWDYESGVTDRQDRVVRGFAFDQPSPLAERVRNAPGAAQCPACADLEGGLLFAGAGGVPRSLFDPDRNNFQPRLGFSYSLSSRTVIRGGYGLYYQYRSQFGSQTGFFVDTPYIANDISGRVGVPELGLNTLANPFPNGLVAAPGASQGLLTQVGQSISFDDPTNRVPRIHAFNLTVGRQLAQDLMVEVSYVGSRIRDLAVGKNINAISAADMSKGAAYLQERVPNPFAGLLPGSGFNGATVQRQQLLRPYPQFDTVTENSMSIGKTWYNAIQVIVQKRMSHGLKFTSSYTYSRTKERNSFLNAQDTELVEQPTDYDRPHIWVFSGTYELPFGKGRRFGADARGLRNVLIGGWQFNWDFAAQSGRALDQPGGLEPIASAKLDHPTPERWFNTCYFDLSGVPQKCLADETPVWRQRPPFTLRTTPNRFSDIRVPWKPTLDASLFKTFRFNSRYRVQIRVEAFNAFNSVIYPAPNTDFASQNFGRIPDPKGTIYFPRNVQLGVKFLF